MANMFSNTGFDPAFLSQNQQDLLMAALQSNNPDNDFIQNQQNLDFTTSLDPSMLSVSLPNGTYNDFDFGFDDQQLFDAGADGQVDGDYDLDQDDHTPEDDEHDDETLVTAIHEKRKSMADDKSENENGAKRREGEEKQAKKPGRKPLTSEPTTKRKAQNRAAQRAFRERKEKHLKDLEDKVAELEKSSESTNHENGMLRAKVDRLQSELREFRKRLSTQNTTLGRSPPSASLGSFSSNSGGAMNNFSFDFPQFGTNTYGNSVFGSNVLQASPQSTTVDYSNGFGSRHTSTDGSSPQNQVNTPATSIRSNQNSISQDSPNHPVFGDTMFKPANLNTQNSISSDYNIFASPTTDLTNSASNEDPAAATPSRLFTFKTNSMSSPSASSSSNSNGPSSSCGTSPEPTTGLNSGKEPTLDTIDESTGTFSNPITSSAFDFSTTSTSNASAIPLFGDYDFSSWSNLPENSSNLMADGAFTGGYFNDTPSLFDFASPQPMSWNDLTGGVKTGLTPAQQKTNPFDSTIPLPMVPEEHAKPVIEEMLNCNKIWDKIQQRPDFKDLDIDNLCTELRKKAKCSETGVVIDKHDVDAALQRLPNMSS